MIFNKSRSINFLCLLIAACIISTPLLIFTQEPDESESQPENNEPRKSVSAEDVSKLERIVSRLRNMEFKDKVKIGFKNKKELKKKIVDDYQSEEWSKESANIQKALVKMGLIPSELDLNKFMVELLTEQIAGFYDPEAKELYLIEADEGEKMSPEALQIEMLFGVPYTNFTGVHELTHALQDQNYNLRTLPMNSLENDDIATAVQALVEGDASYVMYDYLMQRIGRDLALFPDIIGNMDNVPLGGKDVFSTAPNYIKEGLLFPYMQGLHFVLKVKSEYGWDMIDNMYEKRLPASTEQILHPEKYTSKEPDNPITVTLPDLTGFLPAEQYEKLFENVIGEFTLTILIKEYLPSIKNKQIAAGWGGDKFAVFEKKGNPLSKEQQEKVKDLINELEKGKPENAKKAESELFLLGISTVPFLKESWIKAENAEVKQVIKRAEEKIQDANTMLVWYTTWDTAKDAKEFYDAFFKLLAKKYDNAEIIEQTAAKDEGKTIWSLESNAVSLEIRDKMVLVIECIPRGILAKVSSSVWQNTKTEELKEVKRIELEEKKEEEK
ncbi:MAG: hypothetical protein HY811_09900 [Planctomycetes bacterium]|nr:hypothetical protein [Planctomycetota bacterium]